MYLDYLYLSGTINKDHSNLSSIGIEKEQFYRYFGNVVDKFIKDHIDSYLECSNKRAVELPELITEYIRIVTLRK